MRKLISPGQYFMNGNFACAEAALVAGCRFFAGYPITPSSEILERMSVRLPEVEGHFIEMEDEIGSMAAIVGASLGGLKSMTATSGPGFSLMQENIGLGIITETPAVVVNEMRGGPSTGLPTRVGQGDVMQARWGTHGDHESITYVPNSVQEMFDLTIKAFNAAEKFRQPVFLMPDQVIGHMSEKLVVKEQDQYEIVERKIRDRADANRMIFNYADDFAPMVLAGTGFRGNVDSLTHDERGYPSNDPAVEEKMLDHILGKIRRNADRIIEYEEFMVDDADTIVVSYGITSRAVKQAVKDARSKGLSVGMFRPVTLWPFPDKRIHELSQSTGRILVAEINYGQYSHAVREYSSAPVEELSFVPGMVPSPASILKEIERRIQG